MQFVSDHLIGKRALIMQSDIYLGEVRSGFWSDTFQICSLINKLTHSQGFTEENLRTLNSTTVMALSRYEKRPGSPAEGGCGKPSFCPLYKKAVGGYLSHDAFLMKLAEPLRESALELFEFAPNLFGSENVFIHMLKRVGFQVTNPCMSLIIWHNHCSQLRPQSNISTEEKRIDHEICGTWHCEGTDYPGTDGYVNEGPTYI